MKDGVHDADAVDDVDVDDDVDDDVDNVDDVDDVGDIDDWVDNVDVDNVGADDDNLSQMMRRRRSRRSYENKFCRLPVGKNPSQELSGKNFSKLRCRKKF